MISLNILACNRVGLLPTILKQCQGYFDIIRVLDGTKNGGIEALCNRFQDGFVFRFSHTWDYSLTDSLQFLLSYAHKEEWFFYIADDELPSRQLLENLPELIDKAERLEKYMLGIPFTVRHDGFDCEDLNIYIHQARAFNLSEKAREYGVLANDKFVLGRCFKVFPKTRFDGNTHEQVIGYPYERLNIEYPIIHIKTPDDFIRANLWTSVINPTGQGLSGDSLLKFQEGIKTSKLTGDQSAIEDLLQSGDISQELMLWIDKYSNSINAVEFSWFAIYYFKYHPKGLLGWFDFINDSRFHLYFDMLHYHYKDNELIIETILHDEIKLKLLELGIKTVGDLRSRRVK